MHVQIIKEIVTLALKKIIENINVIYVWRY